MGSVPSHPQSDAHPGSADNVSSASFAGNSDPSFVIPTCIATRGGSSSSSGSRGPAVASKPSGLGGASSSSSHLSSKRGIEDLDFFIGDEALANSKTYNINYPIKHGMIDDWDHMERYWEQCIFKYLRTEPEDHHFLLVRHGPLSKDSRTQASERESSTNPPT